MVQKGNKLWVYNCNQPSVKFISDLISQKIMNNPSYIVIQQNSDFVLTLRSESSGSRIITCSKADIKKGAGLWIDCMNAYITYYSFIFTESQAVVFYNNTNTWCFLYCLKMEQWVCHDSHYGWKWSTNNHREKNSWLLTHTAMEVCTSWRKQWIQYDTALYSRRVLSGCRCFKSGLWKWYTHVGAPWYTKSAADGYTIICCYTRQVKMRINAFSLYLFTDINLCIVFGRLIM